MQILSDSQFQFTYNHNQFDTCLWLYSYPIILQHIKTQIGILPARPSGLRQWLASVQSGRLLVRIPLDTFFFFIFSAPEPKAQVHYCDHALSVVRPSVRR